MSDHDGHTVDLGPSSVHCPLCEGPPGDPACRVCDGTGWVVSTDPRLALGNEIARLRSELAASEAARTFAVDEARRWSTTALHEQARHQR